MEIESANNQATNNPTDPNNIKSLSDAESILTRSLRGFYALMENYPDLKADQTMQQLMEELAITENKIGFARQSFNDSVMNYNIFPEQFPNVIVARALNFIPAELW